MWDLGSQSLANPEVYTGSGKGMAYYPSSDLEDTIVTAVQWQAEVPSLLTVALCLSSG